LKTAAIKEVLEFLVGGELIAKIQNSNGDSSLFKTTPRGEEALLAYYKLLRDYFAK
jgi:predicted transcriptional regulator